MSFENPATLGEAAAAIRARKVSSVELTLEALQRADKSQLRLNAFIEIEHEAALEAARQADARLANGDEVGPLHGVPLAHKDMFDVAGKVTGCASKIRSAHVAGETSTVMTRLQAAGALRIGRLNMAEFAFGSTGHNHHYGRTRNPIDPERVTGGSSSGSGAAVGGGVVLAALGSDTAGSIRVPASCCGVVGIKPTQNRVSRHGVMPLAPTLDCAGPIARTVGDAYQLLQLISGPDRRDATCADLPPPVDLMTDISALRIGVGGGVFTDGLEPDVARALDDAVRALEPLARAVIPVEMPETGTMAELAHIIPFAEGAGFHLQWLRDRPDDYGPQVRLRLVQGLAIPASVYFRTLQLRTLLLQRCLEEVFSYCDVMIAPVMPFLPPIANEVDDGTGERISPMLARMTILTRAVSYLGLPAISLPAAVSAGGLRVGLQVVAPPWREDLAAAAAARLEAALALPPLPRA